MAIDAYDPDTGFTRDMEYAEKDVSSMMWRFVNPNGTTPFRLDPMDSLMEARGDAWLLQWENEDGDNAGEVPCGPMLTEFADEMAFMAHNDPLNGDWARHWADLCHAGRYIEGARGAARHCEIALKEDGRPYVRGFLAGACSKARGVFAS